MKQRKWGCGGKSRMCPPLFRCGDVNCEGQKILQQYAQDLRGHFARHAQAVLDERKQK